MKNLLYLYSVKKIEIMNDNSTINYPSYQLSKLIFEDGLTDKTYLSWERTEFWTVTIPTEERKKVVSERYIPKPTWNEVIDYLCTKYQFIFQVQGGTNGSNNERVGKLFFYEFTDREGNTHFGRNNEMYLVYEDMITEYLKVKFSIK